MIFLLDLRCFNKLPFAMDHHTSPCYKTLKDGEEVLQWKIFQTVLHGLHFLLPQPRGFVMGTFLEYLKINYS